MMARWQIKIRAINHKMLPGQRKTAGSVAFTAGFGLWRDAKTSRADRDDILIEYILMMNNKWLSYIFK